MTPKQYSRFSFSKVQELENALSEVDHRSFDQKMQDALIEGIRQIHAIPAAAVQRGLLDGVREQREKALNLLRGVRLDRPVVNQVEKTMEELDEEAKKVSMDPDEDTAYHESGHFVVGYCAGATVGDITCCEYRHPTAGLVWGGTDIENYPSIEAEVVTMLAGPLAETRFTAHRSAPRDFRFDTRYVPTCGDPIQQINLRVPCDPQTALEFEIALGLLQQNSKAWKFAECMREAQTILNVSSVWAAIEALAGDLFKAGKLTGEIATGVISGFVQPMKQSS